jgi:hypothetical protein
MPLQDNLNMYKKILIILTALVILTGVYYYFRPMQTRVIIGDNTFYVDVVFVYDHDEQYRFWMKNMRFPIDILWIKGNIIVDITKNIPIPSGSDLPVYFPEVPVNIVLELPAGTVDTYGITTGSTATFRN